MKVVVYQKMYWSRFSTRFSEYLLRAHINRVAQVWAYPSAGELRHYTVAP
jgi:hypothetical protein